MPRFSYLKAAILLDAVAYGYVDDMATFNMRVDEIDEAKVPEIAIELHQAMHFLEDADMRGADAEYHRLQREALKRAAATLRNCST